MFAATDLRGTVYKAAEFAGCQFIKARLDKVDFQSSTFTDCIFEGELREVMFYRRGFRGEEYPENRMQNVDFSRAKLRWTEFRGLDLNEVCFPDDADHIVLTDYPRALQILLTALKGHPDAGHRSLVGLFEHKRKWLGAHQQVGVLNRKDLVEAAGESGLQAVLEILGNPPP